MQCSINVGGITYAISKFLHRQVICQLVSMRLVSAHPTIYVMMKFEKALPCVFAKCNALVG